MGGPGSGRQSDYTPELADAIVEWIANGKTLRDFCRQDGMPNFSTVYAWLDAHEDFSLRFARARDDGADVIAQECMAIADTPLEGAETKVDADGKVIEIKRSDMLGHRKLQIDTRLKLLAKWNPKKYGDKMNVDMSIQQKQPLVIQGPDDEAN